MKCEINLVGFQRFDEGTKPIKNICQKKNIFPLTLSEISIAIKYDQFLNYYKFSIILLVYLNILRFHNNPRVIEFRNEHCHDKKNGDLYTCP